MEWPPAVVVHGWGDACAALAPGRPVTLLSGRGAAVYGGVGWWRAMLAASRAGHPATPCRDILDCADAPGAAMAALRRGQPALVLDAACPAFAAVTGAASECGAVILAARPVALDLAELDLNRPGASHRLRAWLAADDRPGRLR